MEKTDQVTTFLCACCGCEVRMDWCAPCFGLCEACEERMQQQPVSYSPIKPTQNG